MIVKRLVVLCVFASVLLAACTRSAPPDAAVASDFTLQDMNGMPVSLSDYRGKTVLLEFWATWCPPCRESVPGLERLHNAYKDKGLVVLAVSMDLDNWDGVRFFISDRGITYRVLKGNDEVAALYQVRSIPMLLVLDKEGKITKRYLGFSGDDELEKDVRTLL